MRVSQACPVKKREKKSEKEKKTREKRKKERNSQTQTRPGSNASLKISHVYSLLCFQIFLSQNHWNGCDPISLQGKKKKSHSHASASISHSSSSSSLTSKLSKCGAFLTSAPCIRRGQGDRTLDLDPISAELEKRRRRRCLILSTLFTLAIILGIFLVTSFVMFVISSYRKYTFYFFSSTCCLFTCICVVFLFLFTLDTSLTKCCYFAFFIQRVTMALPHLAVWS